MVPWISVILLQWYFRDSTNYANRPKPLSRLSRLFMSEVLRCLKYFCGMLRCRCAMVVLEFIESRGFNGFITRSDRSESSGVGCSWIFDLTTGQRSKAMSPDRLEGKIRNAIRIVEEEVQRNIEGTLIFFESRGPHPVIHGIQIARCLSWRRSLLTWKRQRVSSKVQLRLWIAWFWRLHLRLTRSQGPLPKLSGNTARQFKALMLLLPTSDAIGSPRAECWVLGSSFCF